MSAVLERLLELFLMMRHLLGEASTQERPQLRPPRDAYFQVWERRGRDYVLVCRRCMLVVGLYASQGAVGGGQLAVYVVRDEKKRLVRFFLRPCRDKFMKPQNALRQGQARSVLTRLENGEYCDGKCWKLVTPGTS